MLDQMSAFYADNWPVFLAVTIAGFVGSISLLALAQRSRQPDGGRGAGQGAEKHPFLYRRPAAQRNRRRAL